MAFFNELKAEYQDDPNFYAVMDQYRVALDKNTNIPTSIMQSPSSGIPDMIEGDDIINWELFTTAAPWDSESTHCGTTLPSTYTSQNGSMGSENSAPSREPSTQRKLSALSIANTVSSQHSSPTREFLAFQLEETPSPIQAPISSWQQHPHFESFVDDLMKSHEKQSAAKRERRKEQNRKAQQAYRERREQRFEVLRAKIESAERHCEGQFHQIRKLQCDLTRLKDERETLRKLLQAPNLLPPTKLAGLDPSLQSVDTRLDLDNDDDLLAYGARKKSTG